MASIGNNQQNEFLEACKAAMDTGGFKQAVFGFDGRGKNRERARFELVSGVKKSLVRYTNSKTGAEKLSDFSPELVYMTMRSSDISPFQSATLFAEDFDLHYSENRKKEPRLYKSKATMRGKTQEHNRQKKYVLAKDRPYLHGLGIASDNGEIHKTQYGKFRQIANFVEIMDRSIGHFVERVDAPITLLDLGCGKGYLTFAAYDYIRARAKHEPQAAGIDIKTNVIDLCNQLAKDISFTGLEFRNARIEPERTEPLDILIALHACDTATDDALALGVRSGMKYFFCAPCCQAQIAAQSARSDPALELINQFPLMQRRQADIVTDVCRALLLNAVGYEVTFLEFTSLEHTSKNIMLSGRVNPSIDRKKAYSDYEALKISFGFAHHALEDNLRDLL